MAVDAPVFQLYPPALAPLSVMLCPEHIGLFPVMVIVGVVVTVTTAVALEVQVPFEPVKVYVVVAAGLTLMLLVTAPVFQE